MRPNPRVIIPVFLIMAISGLSWWYFSQNRSQAEAGKLSASGTIEATQVIISPEMGGTVMEVLVQEGSAVQIGDILVRFKDDLLHAQFEQARASVALAEANYNLIAAGPAPEQRQAAIAAAELELTRAQQELDDLNENAALLAAQALHKVATIDKALDKANQRLDNIQTNADQADVDAAWSAVVVAQDQLERAQDKYEPFENRSEDNVARAILLNKVAEAQKHYDAVVTRYNNIIGTANQFELALAESEVILAQAQLEDARREHEILDSGPDPEAVALATARQAVARANLAAAKAGTSSEQLAVAQAQVEVARGALKVIQAQMDKLVLQSPIQGIVLSRSLEPGEVVLPGSPVLTLAQMDELRITVYIPEDRYGAISIGELAEVVVDSFPGETFDAIVVRISDRAEFTPRNVQTEEGRRTTVFSIELSVKNPEARLKPGMPADVTFGE